MPETVFIYSKRKVDGQDTEFEMAPAELALQWLWQRIFLSQNTFSVAGFIQDFAPCFLCSVGYGTNFTAFISFSVKWSSLATSQEYLQLKSLVLTQCWGRKGLYSLERTGGCPHAAWVCMVLTSLHVHGFTWQPAKDTNTFTCLEVYSCTSLRHPSRHPSCSLWMPLLLRKPSQTAEEIPCAVPITQQHPC